MAENQHRNSDPQEQPLTLWEVMTSVFAAGFGVQSEANKRRDFTRGKPLQFIATGILFTALFVVTVIVVVNAVLA